MKTRVIQTEPHKPAPWVRRLAREHPVLSFFVLAYALTWWAVPFGSYFAPGALIAALLVAFAGEGLAGLRAIGARLVKWRVGWYWYALALAVPLAAHAAAIGANLLSGAAPPDTGQFTPWYGVALALGLFIVDPTGGPLGEEPSFRGFAQVTLQRTRTPLVATCVLAVAVTGWHLPLFIMPQFGLRPFDAITTVAVTFWYGWLFNRAAGSALITLLAHAAEAGVDVGPLWPSGVDATRAAWLYLAAWVSVAAVLLAADRRLWTRPARG